MLDSPIFIVQKCRVCCSYQHYLPVLMALSPGVISMWVFGPSSGRYRHQPPVTWDATRTWCWCWCHQNLVLVLKTKKLVECTDLNPADQAPLKIHLCYNQTFASQTGHQFKTNLVDCTDLNLAVQAPFV